MAIPQQPMNPRVVYPDGNTIPIRKLWYGNRILNTHVWIAEDPQFVPWEQGVRTEYDPYPNVDNEHAIIVGFDVGGHSTVQPVVMDAETLAAVLHEMGNHVAAHDSLEGNIQYEPTDAPQNTYQVTGLYRVGNRHGGQGGMRVIGDTSPQ